jgi:curved DNA-binding protein CbpA
MNKNKDYYAILGVHPTAEIAVIGAAYKALAKRYHPDVSQDNPEEAHRRMQEINEAYEILSDTTKRKEYDDLKGSGTQEAEDFFRGEEDKEPKYDPLEEDWKVALEYYPQLQEYLNELSRISWKLGYGFKAYIIDSREYRKSEKIYINMRKQFLERYFGENETINEFAKNLIFQGKKEALAELNKVVRILGINKSFEKTDEVVFKIERKYNLGKFAQREKDDRSSSITDDYGLIFLIVLIFVIIWSILLK